MAETTKKRSAAKAAEVKEEAVAVAETVAAEAPAAKKTAAKKSTTAKKTAEKKPAAKKAPAKKAAEASENVYIQYNGAELTSAGLIERAKAESGVKAPKKVDVYVKPDENMVYYVVDTTAGSFTLS